MLLHMLLTGIGGMKIGPDLFCETSRVANNHWGYALA